MVNTVERNVGAILEEALETVKKNFLAYADHEYDEDDTKSVAREIELRSLVYTSLTILGEVVENTSSEFEKVNKLRQAHYKRANEYINRTIEAERKIKELTLEKERLEKEVDKLRARGYNPEPFMIRVDGLGPDPDASRYKIRCVEAYLNQVLKARGLVWLSDVYKELGLDTPANNNVSKVCGWKKPNTDVIHFDVYKHETENSFIVVADASYHYTVIPKPLFGEAGNRKVPF